jgi:hypothetical protein
VARSLLLSRDENNNFTLQNRRVALIDDTPTYRALHFGVEQSH